MESDVVVVGSGAAGLTAAIVAALEGLKVLVLESTGYFGGTTAYSGGGVWIPNNHLMKSAGQDDSREDADAYLQATLGEGYDPAIVNTFLDNAPAMLRYLEDRTEVKLLASPIPDYTPDAPGWRISRCLLTPEYDGKRLGRRLAELRPPLPQLILFGGMQIDFIDMAHLKLMHRSPAAFVHVANRLAQFYWQSLRHGRGTRLINGNALAARLLRSAIDAGADLRTRVRARSLINEGGRIAGVIAEIDGQRISVRARKGVILASGGFGANAEMRRRHIPMADDGWSLQPEGCQGDGINMGVAAGGVLNQNNVANGIWSPMSAMRDTKGDPIPFPHLIFDRHCPGSIVVDRSGHRFVNEGFHYQNFGDTMHRRGVTAGYLIADHTFQRTYGMGLAGPAPMSIGSFLRSGYLIRANTLRELADRLGIDAPALEKTVADFNGYATAGKDPDFQRGDDYYSRFMGDAAHEPNPSLGPIVTAPFYAVELRPGDLSSVCGLNTNVNSQVLTRDGTVIEGLYAAGLDMNTMMKGRYPGGGSSLGPAMTFGYIAALHLAGALRPVTGVPLGAAIARAEAPLQSKP
jgi:succinate dehydrogenase/fumarate reductase flavoprotein subunit